MFDDEGDDGLDFAAPEPDGGLCEQVASETEKEPQRNEAPYHAQPPPRQQAPPSHNSYRQRRVGEVLPEPPYTEVIRKNTMSPKINLALAFAAGIGVGVLSVYVWDKYKTVRKNPWFKAANAARSMFS